MTKKVFVDYRNSHKGRGADYHESFHEIPHRKMMYQLECNTLKVIIRKYFKNSKIDYLDFACGTGRIISAVSPMVQTATGTDISETMVAVAKNNTPKAKFIVCDITRDDVSQFSKYNLITAFRFFPNAEPDLRKDVFVELSKLLVGGGLLVFNNHVNLSSSVFKILNLCNKPYGKEGVNSDELIGLAKKSGFTLEKTYHAGVMPFLDSISYLPISLLTIIEILLFNIPFLKGLVSNQILVFKKCA